MARKSGFISVLQYDERTLTRTRVKPGTDGAEILAFDQERGAWPVATGALEGALTAFLTRLNVAEDTVVTVLPRHQVTVRIVNLPTHDPVEAGNMIRFSAEEYVPYPVEELVIQHAILRREPGGESKVLAVLAHKDVLKAHLAPLRKVGIIPERVLLSTVCLANAVSEAKVQADGPYGLINLGSNGLEVLVFQMGKLLAARGVISDQDWAVRGDDANNADEEIAIEVRGTLSAYRRESEDGEGVDRLYLASDYPVALEERAEALANQTGKDCAPASFINALLQGQPATLTAIGAALAAQGRGAIEVNLLPPSESRARAMAGAKVLLRRAGIAAGAVAAALLLLFAQAYWQRSAYISELQEQLRQVEPESRGLGEKQEQLRILRQQMKRGASPLQMLAVAAEAAPEKKANVVQFRYNINEGADFFGRALAVDDVQTFASNLRKAATTAQLAFFKNAHSIYEDRGDERGTPVILYQVSAPVESSDAKSGKGKSASADESAVESGEEKKAPEAAAAPEEKGAAQ